MSHDWIFDQLCLLHAPLDEPLRSLLLAEMEVVFESTLAHVISNSYDPLEVSLLGQVLLLVRGAAAAASLRPNCFLEVYNHDMLLIVPDLAQDAHSHFVHAENFAAASLYLLALHDHQVRLVLEVMDLLVGGEELRHLEHGLESRPVVHRVT